MTPSSRLRDYVAPTLSEARLARQFSRSLELTKPSAGVALPLRWSLAVTTVLLVVGLAAQSWGLRWWATTTSPAPLPLAGTVLEGGALEPRELRLPDNSRVELAPSTRLLIQEAESSRTRLLLERGTIQVDVPPHLGRDFRIRAGEFEVSVVGTKFLVELGPRGQGEGLRVAVERGRVRVRSASGSGTDVLLSAGSSWAARAELGSPDAGEGPHGVPSSSSIPSPTGAPEPAPSFSPSATPPSSRGPFDWREVRRDQGSVAAHAALRRRGWSNALAESGPAELFELFELARFARQTEDAAAALDALRRRYRGDSRAGLAAFELGRLRMDLLRRTGPALEAIDDAIALAPEASFREDAQARRVQLLDRLGRRADCKQAQKVYQRRYPSGVHWKVVALLCEHS